MLRGLLIILLVNYFDVFRQHRDNASQWPQQIVKNFEEQKWYQNRAMMNLTVDYFPSDRMSPDVIENQRAVIKWDR